MTSPTPFFNPEIRKHSKEALARVVERYCWPRENVLRDLRLFEIDAEYEQLQVKIAENFAASAALHEASKTLDGIAHLENVNQSMNLSRQLNKLWKRQDALMDKRKAELGL